MARKPVKPEFVVAYEKGASVVEVASILHVSVKKARTALIDAGVTIRPVGRPRKVLVSA